MTDCYIQVSYAMYLSSIAVNDAVTVDVTASGPSLVRKKLNVRVIPSGWAVFLTLFGGADPKEAFKWLEELLFTYLYGRIKMHCHS